MGQKKIKTIDLTDTKDAEKAKKSVKPKKTESSVSKKKNNTEKQKTDGKSKDTKKSEKKTKKQKKQKKLRSRRYRKLKTFIDRKKDYPPKKALQLLCKISNSKIDETVDVDLVLKDKLQITVDFPYSTGKQQKIAVADEKLIKKVEKGEIDFDILLASPKMMGKIAKIAPILGPKGLMPNPKNNTISDNPEKLKKEMEKKTIIQTERKAPLVHVTIGKISMGTKKLLKNLKTLVDKIGPRKIKKAVITSTHSPGIKLQITKND